MFTKIKYDKEKKVNKKKKPYDLQNDTKHSPFLSRGIRYRSIDYIHITKQTGGCPCITECHLRNFVTPPSPFVLWLTQSSYGHAIEP